MDMEIAVGHGANLPHRPAGRNPGLREAKRGQQWPLSREGPIKDPQLASPGPILRPLRLSGTKHLRSGIRPVEPDSAGIPSTGAWGRVSNEAHPQFLTPYYCYYLL